ncbi:hypothetical protein C0995_006201, partial [Termitomyces sp. Mi166
MPKPVPKPIIALASSVAGPSTAPIVSSSVPKPAAAAALSKPMLVKSAGPAVKGGFIFKDSFMATEVPVTQGTLQSGESSDEDGNNNEDSQDDDDDSDNDDSDNDNVAMDVDSAKHPEETQPVAPTKTTVTKVEAPAPAPVPVANKSEEDPLLLYCTEHVPFLLSGLQVPVQFEQNHPSVEQWHNHAHGHYEVACEMLEDARQCFELVHQELQWVMHQHNAMTLYLHNCDMVMDWHDTNNVKLGDFSDTKDLPVVGSFP